MAFLIDLFNSFIQIFRRNIAAEFTRESIRVQKSLAYRLAKEFVQDIYVFDANGYFADAQQETFEGIRYVVKDDRKAVLSMAGQKVMRSVNEYLQFNDNKTDVDTDNIGVFLMYETVFAKAGLTADLQRKRLYREKSDLEYRIERMREIITQYDKAHGSREDMPSGANEDAIGDSPHAEKLFQQCYEHLLD